MAVQYNPAIVTDGLVLCLDAANLKSYPGSGTNWLSAANNFSFSLINGVSFNSSSKSFYFDGSDDYASISESSLNIGSGDFAIDIWYYCTTQTGLYRKIMGSGGYLNPGYVIIINVGISEPIFAIQYGTSTWMSVGGVVPRINSWYHGVVTRLNGIITVYLNNVAIDSITSSYDMTNNTQPINIGCNGYFGEFFRGDIACVKQYRKGLNAQEVLQNFNALRGRFGI